MINATKIKNLTYHHYTYRQALEASEKIDWRVEELIGGDKRLDFRKPFMPESFARTQLLSFLSPDERLALNQIRGNGYLSVFGVLEECILPFILDHARSQLQSDEYCFRAFLEFAGEEAKHIHLFRRFREEFEQGFGTACAVIGPPVEIAPVILAHKPLAVALTVLQGEWMTQRHYLDSVKDNSDLDPQFKSLLKHHWIEEAQHAKLDTLMVEAMSAKCSEQEIKAAIEEYLEIAAFLDDGLKQQVELDLDSLTRATGRILSDSEREKFMEVQLQAIRWTFLGSGMTHPNFLATLDHLHTEASRRVKQIAAVYC
jgi:hypothetical protein